MSLPYDADAAVAALRRADAPMARLIERTGPLTLGPRPIQNTFEALLRAIVYQQLSGKAAATIHRRVLTLFPGGVPTPERLEVLSDETLRGAGLSRAKLAAARDLAARTRAGTVPGAEDLHRMSDDEILRRLTAVRGIGPWTVQMLLIFNLGRPDVLPVSDLGVRKGYMLTYGLEDLPSAGALLEAGERWRPFRSVASRYLWRAVDTVT